MLATLAIIVFFASIIAFFSAELVTIAKKTIRNSRVQLLAPLFFLSWIVISFQQHVLWFLVTCRIGLHYFALFIQACLPFTTNSFAVAKMLSLFILSCVWMAIADVLTMWWKSSINWRIIAQSTSLYIWITVAFLYAVGFTAFNYS